MRLILILAATLTLPGCARSIVSTPPAGCAKLIPAAWADGIEGYPIPEGDTTDDWRKAFVGQSGQLSKANGRTADVINIFRECEKLVNAARP